MSTVSTKPWISAEEYLRLEAREGVRYEYFQGEIFAMVGGTANHSIIKLNTGTAFTVALRGTPCRPFDSDMRVKVEATGLYTYPDLSICCGPRQMEGDTTLVNPTVLVEVLSPSTESYDRGTKFLHFEQIPSLQHYLLIAQDVVRIEHFLRQGSSQWLRTAYKDQDAKIRLESLQMELSIADIYQDVEWEYPPQLHQSTPIIPKGESA